MKRKHLASFFLGVFLTFSGCYPEGAEYIEDLDVVSTFHDTSFDFTSVGTFAIPDSVVKITGNAILNGDPVEFVNPVYANTIIQNIRENMQQYGWTEVSQDGDPDIIIIPAASQTTTYYYDWWDWGCWYWDWWYPYDCWNWYYPYDWWYPYPVYESYTSGSVFMLMTYPEGRTASDNIPVVWTGILNGLLEGGTSSVSSRITNSIDQAFTQSPYLIVN